MSENRQQPASSQGRGCPLPTDKKPSPFSVDNGTFCFNDIVHCSYPLSPLLFTVWLLLLMSYVDETYVDETYVDERRKEK